MTYLAYLLRLWTSAQADAVEWRASLENVHSHERLVFPDLEALIAFLRSQTEENAVDDPLMVSETYVEENET